MLTKAEKNYLQKIEPKKIVKIYPFSTKGKQLGKSIVAKIRNEFPGVKILFMGSTALEIQGQKDIDIYVISKFQDFPNYLPGMQKLFGKLQLPGDTTSKRFYEWKLTIDGYEIEVYLTEPPKRHIKIFKILKSNPKLLKDYSDLKTQFNGKSYRDYQEAKYHFFNRILMPDL